jgi:hypothetical protein
MTRAAALLGLANPCGLARPHSDRRKGVRAMFRNARIALRTSLVELAVSERAAF